MNGMKGMNGVNLNGLLPVLGALRGGPAGAAAGQPAQGRTTISMGAIRKGALTQAMDAAGKAKAGGAAGKLSEVAPQFESFANAIRG